MKYSLEDAKLHFSGSSFQPIEGKPSFSTLAALKEELAQCLKKLVHPIHSTQHPKMGWAGLIMTKDEWELQSPNTVWTNPPDVGTHWTVKPEHMKDKLKKTNDHEKWKASKDLHDSYISLQTALSDLLTSLIDPAYHFKPKEEVGGPLLGFGMASPNEIFDGLFSRYGKLKETERAYYYAQYSAPYDKSTPLEQHFRLIDKTHHFFTIAPECTPLPDEYIIMHVSSSIRKAMTDREYNKALTAWKSTGKTTWYDFKLHMIATQNKLEAEYGDELTTGDVGYGTAFHTTHRADNGTIHEADDDNTVAETLDDYGDRLQFLEQHLAALSMQTSAANQAVAPPSTITFQNPIKKRKNEAPPTFMPPQQGTYPQPPAFLAPIPGHQPPPVQAQPLPYTNRGRNAPGKANAPYSNVTKMHNNNLYCYTCGFDVDHPGTHCPTPKQGHQPGATRENAHQFHGACMKGAHKHWQGQPAPAAILGVNVNRASFTQTQLPQPPPQYWNQPPPPPPQHMGYQPHQPPPPYQGRRSYNRGGRRNDRRGYRPRGNTYNNGTYTNGRGAYGYGNGYQH